MQKRILFIIPEYSHGGTNKSLENLLHFINREKYDISIYSLYEDGGRLYKDIFAPYTVKKSIWYYLLHDQRWTRKIIGLYKKFKRDFSWNWLYKFEAERIQREYRYDAVIGFQEGAATDFASFVDAKKKTAWIHCDYANYAFRGSDSDKRLYSNFDNVVCVSKAAQKSFDMLMPEFSDRSRCVYNTIDTDEILKHGNVAIEDNQFTYDNNTFIIVSIGRLSPIKQFEEIPGIAKRIKETTKKKFCWYIIGEGESRVAIENNIKINDISDCVKLLGAKDNPYPYIKQASLLACTSKSESFSYVIAEAKVLHTPVITTDFPVSKEVVEKDHGWITTILDMPQLIAKIINDDKRMYSRVNDSISGYSYDNSGIMSDFYKLF